MSIVGDVEADRDGADVAVADLAPIAWRFLGPLAGAKVVLLLRQEAALRLQHSLNTRAERRGCHHPIQAKELPCP